MSAPLTPLDCDLQDYPFMPLHVARLRDSDMAAEESPEACWYGVLLWAVSWHQLPAGSLPNSDPVLTKLIGLGRDVKTFRKHRDGALRGFVLCDDGRLYHPIVAEQVIAGWRGKLEQRWRTECARIKKRNQRDKTDLPLPTFAEFHATLPLTSRLPDVPRDDPPCPQGQTDASPGTAPPCPQGNGIQERETGKGTERETGNLEVVVERARRPSAVLIDPDGSVRPMPILTRQEDASNAMWSIRLAEAHTAGAGGINLTSPKIRSFAGLKAYCEPASGEPCRWEEVLEAIRICAEGARARGDPFHTWDYVKSQALALRDIRLNAHLPPPRQPHEQPAHHDRKQSAFIGKLADVDAAMEVAFQPRGRGD